MKGIFYYRISKKSLRISIYIEATKIKKKLDNRNNRKIMLQKKKNTHREKLQINIFLYFIQIFQKFYNNFVKGRKKIKKRNISKWLEFILKRMTDRKKKGETLTI